jgi:nucleoside 2-deoxyribosyltransferase
MKYDVYFAAPFFSSAEREINERLIAAMEVRGLNVFSPARDGIVAKNELTGSVSWAEISARVWNCDISALENSKLLFAIIDGRSIDEGVCVEIGYAAAKGKPIIAFSSDDRRQFPWGHNPMVIHPIRAIVSDPDRAVLDVAEFVARR